MKSTETISLKDLTSPRQMREELDKIYEEEIPSQPTDWLSEKKTWAKENPGETGMKFSKGKPKWQLMGPLWPAMEEVVKVLTRGAEKYHADNWMDVDRDEYIRAIMSHYSAYASGEQIDSDMGFNHMANLVCSGLFLLWHDGIRRKDAKE